MNFTAVDASVVITGEMIYQDATAIINLILKRHYKFNDALKKVAYSRNVTPNSVRANVCSNLGLTADDWHSLKPISEKAKSKISEALLRRYPEMRSEILKILNI